MIFNAIINWDDPTPAKPAAPVVSTTPIGRSDRP
jgi:hypothetical protein